MLKHEFSNCHPGCEPPKREQPTYCGKVNTAGMGEYYSSHACPPHPGYNIPPVKPLFVPGMSTQEQISVLAGKVDEMVNLLGKYDEKVWGAYDEIVNACICNDAYYSEIETEVGYLPATSAKYTVVHIPFVDRSNDTIRLQLGLAFDNTTNSGLHENVFDASERKLADKLFPAMNIADKWTGKVYWKGAPLNSEDTESFTVGVLKNGFIKVYNQTATTADMNKDSVENAMGVAGVLISGGEKTPDNYGYTDGTVAMVGLGMNYDTQERFFILVEGVQAVGVTSGGGCTADQLADLFKKYGCTVAVLLAYKESVCGLDCGEMLNIPYDESHIPYVPQLNAYWYITKEEHYHNDYVREVAKLMQKYGRSIWTGVINGKTLDAVRDELANLKSQLSQETQDRIDGDTTLGVRIDELGERVTSLYNEIVQSIANEATAREEADTALGVRIDQEITDREQAVADEAKTREEADKALEESGNSLAGKLNQEIEDRKTAIEAEATARNEADGVVLQTMITNVKNLEEADKTLQSNIDKEVSDRQSSDTALQSAIDTLRTDYNAFKTSTSTDLETKTTQINQILADISSVKNLIAGVQQTQSEIDETLTSVQSALSTMEQSFENLKQVVANLQTSWEQYKESMNTQWTEFESTVEQSMSIMESELKSWVTEQLGSYLPLTGTTDTIKMSGPIKGSYTISGQDYTYSIAPGYDGIQIATSNYAGVIHPRNIRLYNIAKNENDVYIAYNTLSFKYAFNLYTHDKIMLGFDTGTINFNNNNSTNVPIPISDYSIANKKYVDDLISSIPTGDYIPITGTEESNPVTGELDVKLTSNLTTALKARTVSGNYETDIKPGTVTLQGEVGNNPVTLSSVPGSSTTPTALRVYDEQRDKLSYIECADPTEEQHATTKKYVDGLISSIPTGNYIPLTGTVTDSPITGNLEFFTSDTTYPVITGLDKVEFKTGSAGSTTAVTSNVGITTDGYIQVTANNPSGEVVGQLSVENGEINVHNNYITNVKDPVSATDGANKQYVDNLISYSANSVGVGTDYTLQPNEIKTFGLSVSRATRPNIIAVTPDMSLFVENGVDLDTIDVTCFYAIEKTTDAYMVHYNANVRNISSSNIVIPSGSGVRFLVSTKN